MFIYSVFNYSVINHLSQGSFRNIKTEILLEQENCLRKQFKTSKIQQATHPHLGDTGCCNYKYFRKCEKVCC